MTDYGTVVNPRPLLPVSRETWAAATLAHSCPPYKVKRRQRRKRRHIARGYVDLPAMKQIMIAFDDDTFGELRAVAVKQRQSFAAVVREMVEWGLQDFNEGNRA